MKKPIALGIECVGSSHSFSVCLSKEGEVLEAMRFTTPINYYEQTRPEVAKRLYGIIHSILNRCNDTVDGFLGRGGRICAAITGVTTCHDREKGMASVWEQLEFPQEQCLASGDIEVLLSGKAGCLSGAVIVWHAGMRAYARKLPHNSILIGGWGPMLGDEGSGYYIGRRALRALTWHRDKIGIPCPELVECIHNHLKQNLDEWGGVWRDIVKHETKESKDQDVCIEYLVPYTQELIRLGISRYALSDLVKPVVEAAQKELAKNGDDNGGVAWKILEKSLMYITNRLDIAIERAELQKVSFPLVIAGGIPLYRNFLYEKLKEYIICKYPNIEICPLIDTNIYHTGSGAALHALTNSLDELPEREVCMRVYDETLKLLLA